MNKSRQLLADVMLVVVLCVAAVMVELETKRGDVDRLRQFVVPTILLGVVLIVGLIIIASKHSKDTPTMADASVPTPLSNNATAAERSQTIQR